MIDVLNGGAQGMAKTIARGPPNAGGGVVATGWRGEISSSEEPDVARCAARYIEMMEVVATKTAGFALNGVFTSLR
jgi:hypothetical protein